ncbi:MAG: DUF29 domain-containing protein [Candidatus Competibacter sp.]|nr:DUF29 domain-containing protein [Candidatus Competibacter sp.]MDG4583263.1 DUF29 domain-containing protein [Candidatus Competibacter sp.]
MPTSIAYDTDFYLWTQQQAALLRQGRLQAVDAENLAEEIESMGKSDRRSIGSHLRNILLHLLKWRYQPERRGTSWIESIGTARDEVEDILADSPSLVPQVDALTTAEYSRARRKAAKETGLPLTTFPEQCPFTAEQITGDYWPD